MKKYLENNNGEVCSAFGHFPFRKRSEHIKRVFMWAQRLMEDDNSIDREVVLMAALFHDIGYAKSDLPENISHAENSAYLCRRYLSENGYETSFIEFVTYLVNNHSSKELLYQKDTPIELITLIEADLLDETGALSIMWDCMMEGAQEIQTFEKTFNHILNYSYKSMNKNPMVTSRARQFWNDKQVLTKEFIKHLSFDIGIEHKISLGYSCLRD